MRLQLSTLMFLQYFVWGAWYVTITTYVTTTLHFKPIEAGLLVYSMCSAPTMALSNSLSFHQMEDPGKTFPGIRVLGTIGWIAAGMTIGFMKVESSVVQLYVAAIVSAKLGLYCFTLPHVPPKKDTKATFREIIGIDALLFYPFRSQENDNDRDGGLDTEVPDVCIR